MSDTVALFAALAPPPDGIRLSAVRFGPVSPYHIARDAHGDPALVVDFAPGAGTAPPPIRLRHLEYLPRVSATLWEADSGSSVTREVLVVWCRESDAELRRHFLRLAESIVEQLGQAPTIEEADRALRSLVEIFRSMDRSARQTAAGLWGELLVIAESPDVEAAVAAWRSDPRERHDFVWGADCVEVKSTTKPVREHEVALDQLLVPPGGTGVLASVLLVPNQGGTSAAELMRQASSRMKPSSEARARLRAIVAATIGDAWRDLDRVRFDKGAARASIRLYDFNRVPSVGRAVPPEVSSVRFTVDVSNVEAIGTKQASLASKLCRALW